MRSGPAPWEGGLAHNSPSEKSVHRHVADCYALATSTHATANILVDFGAPPPSSPSAEDVTPTDETGPSDADGETPTTASETDDDETSPLA